jgi:putative heme transporter
VLILAGPGIFFVIWTLVGQPAATGGHHTWALGLAAVLLSALSVLVVAAIGGSVRLAEGLGHASQACVNPFRRLFGKPRITTWGDRCVGLRADLLDVLRRDGVRLLACVIGGYGLNAILLVACIWACGVSASELPLTLGLMLYAVGRIATIVQITPGGVGITEIAYTSVYVAALGEAAKPSIVAGVLVYRALTYALPIITGAVAYVIWRIMRRHEIHEEKRAKGL